MREQDVHSRLLNDLAFWQERLRLRDWTIALKVTYTCPTAGQAEKLSDYKDALIELRHPDAIPNTWLGNNDVEVTLVHELLHLQGEALDDFVASEPRWKDHQERTIELTAIALVRLRRERATP